MREPPTFETLQAAKACDDATLRRAIVDAHGLNVHAIALELRGALLDLAPHGSFPAPLLHAIEGPLQAGDPQQLPELGEVVGVLRRRAREVAERCDSLLHAIHAAQRVQRELTPVEEATDGR